MTRAAVGLQELRRQLADVDAERAALQKERKIFRRLGFSTERLNLRLRQLETQRAEVGESIKRCQADQREKATGFAGVGRQYESSPLA